MEIFRIACIIYEICFSADKVVDRSIIVPLRKNRDTDINTKEKGNALFHNNTFIKRIVMKVGEQ
jgi:hypothetical protein